MAGRLLSREAIALLEQLHEARGWRRLDLEERAAWLTADELRRQALIQLERRGVEAKRPAWTAPARRLTGWWEARITIRGAQRLERIRRGRRWPARGR